MHCAASVDLLPNEAHKNINKKFFVDLLEAIGCYTFSLSLLSFIITDGTAERDETQGREIEKKLDCNL